MWKEGDVRGVLEIIRPLDKDQELVDQGLRRTVEIAAGSGVTLLGLSVFLIYLGTRRNRVTVLIASAEGSAIPPPAVGSEEAAVRRGEKPEKNQERKSEKLLLGPAVPQATVANTLPNATAPLEPDEVVVVWRSSRPIGTLTPVRMVIPSDGT